MVEKNRTSALAAFTAMADQRGVVREGTGEPDPLTGKPTGTLVCLEAGHTCTGALCPITEATPEEMRKARQDLRDDEPAAEED